MLIEYTTGMWTIWYFDEHGNETWAKSFCAKPTSRQVRKTNKEFYRHHNQNRFASDLNYALGA